MIRLNHLRIRYGSSDQYVLDLSILDARKLRDRLNSALDKHADEMTARYDRVEFLNASRTA